MESFPFSAEEWARVREACLGIVNAELSEDEAIRTSRFEKLCEVLAELRNRHGDHPVLLETEADFAAEPSEQIALYEMAKLAAVAAGFFTFTIRISLARVLMDDLGDRARALQELLACRDEVTLWAEEDERKEWEELRRQAIEGEGG
jgi:hypothetical protein